MTQEEILKAITVIRLDDYELPHTELSIDGLAAFLAEHLK